MFNKVKKWFYEEVSLYHYRKAVKFHDKDSKRFQHAKDYHMDVGYYYWKKAGALDDSHTTQNNR